MSVRLSLQQPLINHISQTRGELHNKILQNSESLKSLQQDDIYDPFQQPASFFKANIHRQSRKIGIKLANNKTVCNCCNNFTDKQNLDLCSSQNELGFLGSAYPLYFKLTKYFGIIILAQVLISLFFTYFIDFVCEEKCVRFFNIPIIDIAHLDKKMNKQAIQNIFVAFSLTILIIYIKPQIFYNVQEYNDRFLNPSKYTIMVKNFPIDTSKQEIIDYFEDLCHEPIAKINMAYDIEEYTEAFNQKIISLRKLKQYEYKLNNEANKLNDSQMNDLQNQISMIKNQLMVLDQQLYEFQQECQNAKTSQFTGTVFISFKRQQPAKQIVQDWGQSKWREIKFLLFNVALQSPYLQYNGNSLIISQAGPPTDIVWENLRYHKIRSLMNNTILFLCSLGLLVLSFMIQYIVMKYVYPLKKQSMKINDYYLKFQAVLMSVVVISVNALLRILVQRFTQLMQFDSVTKAYSAYINRYVFLYFANSAFLPYLVHAKFDSIDDNKALLIQDIHFILMGTAFSTPLGKLFDLGYIYKIFQRRQLQKYPEKENPYTQHEANQIMEDYTINIVQSYTFITISLFLSSWYGSVAPVGIVFSFVGLVVTYWIDKYQLLRMQSQPESINEKIIKKILNILEILPILYVCGNYVYEYRITLSEDMIRFFQEFAGYGLTQIFLSMSFIGFFVFYRKKLPKQNQHDQTYDELRPFFRTEYDACNPITQQDAHKEWIHYLRSKKLITQVEKRDLLLQTQKISMINAYPLKMNSQIQNLDIRGIQLENQSFLQDLPDQINKDQDFEQPFPTEEYEKKSVESRKSFQFDLNDKDQKINYTNFEIDDYHQFLFQDSDQEDVQQFENQLQDLQTYTQNSNQNIQKQNQENKQNQSLQKQIKQNNQQIQQDIRQKQYSFGQISNSGSQSNKESKQFPDDISQRIKQSLIKTKQNHQFGNQNK